MCVRAASALPDRGCGWLPGLFPWPPPNHLPKAHLEHHGQKVLDLGLLAVGVEWTCRALGTLTTSEPQKCPPLAPGPVGWTSHGTGTL